MTEIEGLGVRLRRLAEGALEAGTPESQRLLVAAILAVVALLIGEAVVTLAPSRSASTSGQSPGSPVSLPTPSVGPAGPSAALMAQVVTALQGCARTTSDRPLSCPQAAARAPQNVGVRWTLHGDPTAGVVLFPGRGDQLPAIVGHFIMVATWPSQSRSLPNKEVVTGLYLTPVEGTAIGPLSYLDSPPPNLPPLAPDPHLSRDAALFLVVDALNACQAATVRDWPVDCPDQALNAVTYDRDSDQVDVRASVEGDLAINAGLDFDRRTGLSILTGGYALRVSWSGPKPGQSRAAGNYRALLTWDTDHLSLLQIVYG